MIFQTHDVFIDGLDAIATQIQTGQTYAADAAKYVEQVISDFEDDMKRLKTEVRETKTRIIGII